MSYLSLLGSIGKYSNHNLMDKDQHPRFECFDFLMMRIDFGNRLEVVPCKCCKCLES